MENASPQRAAGCSSLNVFASPPTAAEEVPRARRPASTQLPPPVRSIRFSTVPFGEHEGCHRSKARRAVHKRGLVSLSGHLRRMCSREPSAARRTSKNLWHETWVDGRPAETETCNSLHAQSVRGTHASGSGL